MPIYTGVKQYITVYYVIHAIDHVMQFQNTINNQEGFFFQNYFNFGLVYAMQKLNSRHGC